MRALGLDLGSKRIGVAVSDRSGTIASPLTVIARGRSRRADHERIAELVRDEDAELVVVGLPRSLSGGDGPAAKAARAEVTALATVVGVPVELHDERFTTVTADARAGRCRRARHRAPRQGRQGRRGSDPAVVAGRSPVSIAEELAREREARRAADARDVNEFRGIDDIDSLEHLDTIDWTSDPWDEPQAAGSVERLALADAVGEVGRLHRSRARHRDGAGGRPRRLVVHPPGQPNRRRHRRRPASPSPRATRCSP